jgi:hypothetical protein
MDRHPSINCNSCYAKNKTHLLFENLISVLAPSSLPPGYELHVESRESKGFTVIVPQGGVREGDIFLAPIPHGYKMEELTDVPTGKWKDGICDLFRYGVCQPALFCAFFCTDIAMGQIMQRMRLSWTGNRTVGGRALNTFRTVLILCVCYGIFDTALGVYIAASMNVTENGYYYYYVSNVSPTIPIIRNVVGVLFTLWSIYALYKTRQNGNYIHVELCMYA